MGDTANGIPRVIGFSGGYGVGKSTAIDLLATTFGLDEPGKLCLVKFAAPLYAMQEDIYQRIIQVYKRPPDFKKDRKLLQWLGTDWGRDTISQTVWVDLWKADATFALKMDSTVVCDDCRFDNEAETVKSLGGIVIKITRVDAAAHAQGGTGIANHASEAGVNPSLVDYTIENNGTLEEFKNSLCELYKRIAGQSA